MGTTSLIQISAYILRCRNVVENRVNRFLRMIPGDSALDVGEQLLVPEHHLLVVEQFEVDFDHLLQCLETPFALLAVLQVEHLLKGLQGSQRFVLLQRFTVVVLVLQIHVRLRVAVLGVFLWSIFSVLIAMLTSSSHPSSPN